MRSAQRAAQGPDPGGRAMASLAGPASAPRACLPRCSRPGRAGDGDSTRDSRGPAQYARTAQHRTEPCRATPRAATGKRTGTRAPPDSRLYSAISLFNAVPAIPRNLRSAASPHPRRSRPPAPTPTATSGSCAVSRRQCIRGARGVTWRAAVRQTEARRGSPRARGVTAGADGRSGSRTFWAVFTVGVGAVRLRAAGPVAL